MTRKELLDAFASYLGIKNFSSSTKKNYLSDVRMFLKWLSRNVAHDINDTKSTSDYELNTANLNSQRLKNLLNQLANVDPSILQIYLSWLKTSGKTTPSINRALAALRQFFTFTTQQQWIVANPAKKISNISINKESTQATKQQAKIIDRFAISLKKEGLSETTIKNYLSDIQSFANWLKKNIDV